MLEPLNLFGEWWLPSNPEKRIKGSLTFNQTDGARLELEDSFRESLETICGISLPIGQEITLQDCIPLSWGLSGSPMRVFAHRVLLGEHFAQPQNAKFYSWHCELSNLFEWLWKSGVEWQDEDNEFEKFTLRYKRPQTISIDIDPKLKLKVYFNHSIRRNITNTEYKIKQFATIVFYPLEKANADEYLKLMQHFRNFLCLATQESTYPKSIIGNTDKTDSRMVEIFYQLDTPVSFTESDIFNSLFSFKDIEYKFDTCLRNWYVKYETLEPVCQLYFGSYYGRFVYQNLKFLSMVQALESYHRRAVSNEELPKEKHRERIARIMNTVPLEHNKWLKEKLNYSNEPSLRERLKYLCDTFHLTIKSLIPDRKYFINKVIDTRNYMTHYDINLKEKSAKEIELFIITEKLRSIVEMCLMREIGFNSKEIDNLICKRYKDRLKQYEH